MTPAAPERPGRALYICYLGLDDPLVHTQVIAYLAGLCARGHVIHLLTFEAGRRSPRRSRRLAEQMASRGIRWHGLRYHKRPSLPGTIYDVIRGALFAAYLMRRHRLEILHARSHVPAAMGLITSRLVRLRLLFDIRGLMAEEYVDADNWRSGSLAFRITKRVERVAIARADGAVVLTQGARELLFAVDDPRAVVIPCCVDIELSANGASSSQRLRDQLGLGNRPVLIYVGKFTGWYLQREMVEFFSLARQAIPGLHLLVLSQSDRALIVTECERFSIPQDETTITMVPAEDVSAYIALSDAALAFIRPCYSKIASSPTKIGEYIAGGVPVVTGRGVGDVERLFANYDIGVVLDSFRADSLREGVQRLQERIAEPGHAERCRQAAREQLSLTEVGVPRYSALYHRLAVGSVRSNDQCVD